MLNHFQKLSLFFLLCSTPPIYAMETNNESNQSLYNPKADSELLQIINILYEERLATSEDWKDIIRCLENGANPNLKGKGGTTILQLACLGPSYNLETKEYFHYFLEHGANPNICNDEEFAPLHAVLEQLKNKPQNFDPEMLETLLKYNANPDLPYITNTPDNQTTYSMTPLAYAATLSSEDSVKILIKNGADINAKGVLYFNNIDYYSVTPLERAILMGKPKMIEVLCKNYASLKNVSNVYGKTAFEFAVKKFKNPELIIKNLIINARFKLPVTEKKLDLTALTLLLILKHHKFKFQIPEELKFRILAMLPAMQDWVEPDSKLYKGLYAKNYKNPSLFARLIWHKENIRQIVNKENKSGETIYLLLMQNEKTKKIIPQLQKDIDIILQYSRQQVLPDNLALQICNNYEELLEEEQAQNRK